MLRAYVNVLSPLRRWSIAGARKAKESRPDEFLPGRGTAGFALAVVLVLTGAFFYDRYSTWIDRQFVQIEGQREALSQLENLEAGLSDAATAVRGFVLSGESVHVNDYRLAAAATRERLAAMERQERTSGSPGDLLLRQAWSYLDSLDEMVNSVERRGGRPPLGRLFRPLA